MNEKVLSILDDDYQRWISSLKKRYRQSQIKAAVKVNAELISLYWALGRDIATMKPEEKWGEGFYKTLSRDLRESISDAKGFSVRNLQRMRQFYELFPSLQIAPQPVAHVEKGSVFGENKITQQVVAQIKKGSIPGENSILQQVAAQIGEDGIFKENEITPQLVAQIVSVPWGHICLIMNHAGQDRKKALFYITQTVLNNWSRAMLFNFIKSDLYARQGKAITNFDRSLPEEGSGLAREIIKDPYDFNFLTMEQGYDEKQLKDALIDNIQRFLLELGTGFAYLGREYRLVVGGAEQFIDMLFYNTRVHAYVVIEVKVDEFEPRDIGQVGTYAVAVDHLLKTDRDEKTIGLLICKGKNEILARYALELSSQPLGISSYELSNLIPEKFQGDLPTIEEIENELNRK